MPAGLVPFSAHQALTADSTSGPSGASTRYAPAGDSVTRDPSGSCSASAATASPGVARNVRISASPVSSAVVPSATTRPAVDDHDVVGEPLGLVEQVGGEHHGDAVGAQLLDELPRGDARLGVHPGAGLVEEDQVGSSDEGAGQGEALLLAAGHPAVRRPHAGAGRAARRGRRRREGSHRTTPGAAAPAAPGTRRRCRRSGASRPPGAAGLRRRRPGPGPRRAPSPSAGGGSPRRSRPCWSCRPRSARGARSPCRGRR